MKRDVYLGNGCFGSGKELKHYKYISRKKVGGKWVYEYNDSDIYKTAKKNIADRAANPNRQLEPKKPLDRAAERVKINKKLNKSNQNRQLEPKKPLDRASEQVKLAEKRTAAKKAKVANIKSASKMKTTITDDSNIRSAKKPASTPVGKVSDEYKKNLEFNSQKNDYKLTIHPNGAPSSKKETPKPVGNVSDEYKKNLEYNSQKNDYGNGKRKSALSENNKQNRLLKNLKKAIANARKKKKVQKK